VTDRSSSATNPGQDPVEIDIGTAQPARMTNYLLGGDDNFAVDREVIEYITAALPGGSDAARAAIRASRAFVERAVRYLASAVGISQFLSIGTGIPPADHVAEVAQRFGSPGSRIVYVITDPVVLARARSLWRRSPEGVINFVRGDVRDPERILRRSASTLALTRPVAVLVFGVMHLVHDTPAAHQAVARLLADLPSGSHLVMTHLASDIRADELAGAVERMHRMAHEAKVRPFALRTHAEVARFFDGLELVEPGVVPTDLWRPDEAGESTSFIYAGVGRKP
jgi:hypothetical protein